MTISAKIILDAISESGVRITTFELEYPRFIHSELMTARVFSRNSASSRAIPIERMIQNIRDNPATPIHWGRNQSGMSAREELEGDDLELVQNLWNNAKAYACDFSKRMADAGAHKQIANRITEPFQHMKVVLTTTELNNWWHLRDHVDAQPEIGGVEGGLAKVMRKAYNDSTPQLIKAGQWFLPYVEVVYDSFGEQHFYDEMTRPITLEQAKMISVSCCAQVSYRKNDGSLEKAEAIYNRLIESEPCHSSPCEHQATPLHFEYVIPIPTAWPEGVTHMDRGCNYWSGNFREWIQLRQLIPNNVRRG